MKLLQRLGEHVQEHHSGMARDLLFALVWVGLVSVIFGLVEGPQWAYYLLLAAGIPAYYGFVFSMGVAKASQRE
ncbi:hypothetical protein [Halanaeroarchaeum sulfurireducens]|uniref:DUF8119 domain-containing protein n=1 Tax=Halanaeroarchaeum sulfurireducens TaxID=1604004 RepID=A0A0F7P9L4_9EURY|nr:hypothetical protein [Halanaeroarchaeum sulfurireducens]AKH96900.1 hypothetical protein HLASF_0394 [Halanaeroarchaeum sulfurireducens]ALG81302.1 hypothetical protein HLASA_0393 [Halanaeroarchaeum sulfurireducens]